MNILILNWRDIKNPKSGGAEIVTLEHAKAWVRAGNNVTWFTSSFTNSKKNETIDDVNIIRKGGSLSIYLLAPFFYLFNRKKFDLVIDEIHGLPFFTPIYVRKPKIAFIHEVAGEIWDYMYPFPFNKLGKLIESVLLLSYKKTNFFTISNSTKKTLVKTGIERTKINVINSGVKEKIVKKLPVKEKHPTFIFVSRVVKMKGIEEVVRAFFIILRHNKNAKLWIVGDGQKKYVDSLKKLIKDYGFENKVIFFGRVSEEKKLKLMRKSHILLHASVKEGWGLVVVEAASQATPAVVYNVAGLRDSVKNGKTGIVVAKNTPGEMANESLKLLKDKKKYLNFQKNSLLWAKSLTWKRATEQSLKLISKVYGIK